MQTRPAAAVINLFGLRIQAAAAHGSHRNQLNRPDFHLRAEAAFRRIGYRYDEPPLANRD
jgi:hypothetical protein